MNNSDRLNRDGELVKPHALKLERMYFNIFAWLKDRDGSSMADVIREALNRYSVKFGYDIKKGDDAKKKE